MPYKAFSVGTGARCVHRGTPQSLPAALIGTLPSTSGRTANCASVTSSRCHPRSRRGLVTVQAFGKQRSGSNQSSVSSSLIAVLKDEIKYERESYRRNEELEDGPPNGFELSDEQGSTWFFLLKQFNNENIIVRVDIDAQPDLDEGEDEEEDIEVEDDEPLPVEFQVSIVKDGDTDSALLFNCESDGEYLSVSGIQLRRGDPDDDEAPPYRGPIFEDLDDTLQQAFTDFLEERGVNPYLGEYIRLYAEDKAALEYQRWLQGVREFIAR